MLIEIDRITYMYHLSDSRHENSRYLGPYRRVGDDLLIWTEVEPRTDNPEVQDCSLDMWHRKEPGPRELHPMFQLWKMFVNQYRVNWWIKDFNTISQSMWCRPYFGLFMSGKIVFLWKSWIKYLPPQMLSNLTVNVTSICSDIVPTKLIKPHIKIHSMFASFACKESHIKPHLDAWQNLNN